MSRSTGKGICFRLARFHVTPQGWGSSLMFLVNIVKLHGLCIHCVSFIYFVGSIVTCVGLVTRDSPVTRDSLSTGS